VMMNDPRFLRAPTVFKGFYDMGARVAVVTAKDKLRTLLGHGLRFDEGRAICFSSEKSDQTTMAECGIDNAAEWLGRPVPEVYSAELSEFVFAAGVRLLASFKPDVMYLTTTDYVQHKYAPDQKEAMAFYAMFDKYLAQLDAMGAAIVVTADHGMKPKHLADGTPDVIYVQDLLDDWLGKDAARVILPITDPYVVHHGALGSFATIYLADGTDVAERIRELEGIHYVESRIKACADFELPEDRVGDLVVVSDKGVVLGTRESEHDLSGLDAPLRSHGGISEQRVPLTFNRLVEGLDTSRRLRNFDAFDLALNHIAVAG
jgi:phosphonoacetate hydrolase